MNGSPESPMCEGALPANPITSTEQGNRAREIPLTQGKVALVDDEDYERLSAIKWHTENRGYTCYAAHSYREGGKVMKLPMQREIMGTDPNGLVIDHINGNGLDNRRENLRFVTQRKNCANLHIDKKSKHEGVSWNSQQGKWVVKPLVHGRIRQIGSFDNEDEAARLYQDFLAYELECKCSDSVVSLNFFCRKRTKRQPDKFPDCLSFLVSPVGIEPTTY